MPKSKTKNSKKAQLIRQRKEQGLCYRCGKRPPEGGFQICKQCSAEWNQRRALHKARYNTVHRATRHRIKLEVFEAYGGKRCACCGESHEEFLSIDHIEGGGARHRRDADTVKYRGSGFYWLLKKHGYPDGYQVLCMNCNLAKRNENACPHKKIRTQGTKKQKGAVK